MGAQQQQMKSDIVRARRHGRIRDACVPICVQI